MPSRRGATEDALDRLPHDEIGQDRANGENRQAQQSLQPRWKRRQSDKMIEDRKRLSVQTRARRQERGVAASTVDP